MVGECTGDTFCGEGIKVTCESIFAPDPVTPCCSRRRQWSADENEQGLGVSCVRIQPFMFVPMRNQARPWFQEWRTSPGYLHWANASGICRWCDCRSTSRITGKPSHPRRNLITSIKTNRGFRSVCWWQEWSNHWLKITKWFWIQIKFSWSWFPRTHSCLRERLQGWCQSPCGFSNGWNQGPEWRQIPRCWSAIWRSTCCQNVAMRDAVKKSSPVLMEPVMKVEVQTPSDFQGSVIGDLSSRRGVVYGTEVNGDDTVINAGVPLGDVRLRHSVAILTSGKANYSMEFENTIDVRLLWKSSLKNALKRCEKSKAEAPCFELLASNGLEFSFWRCWCKSFCSLIHFWFSSDVLSPLDDWFTVGCVQFE